MSEETVVEELREKLLTIGSAHFTDQRGRTVYLIHTRILGLNRNGVLIAYEKCGAFTFELDRPLNKFRLASAGFPLDIAEGLASLVNRVTRVTATPALTADTKAIALMKPAPKGQTQE